MSRVARRSDYLDPRRFDDAVRLLGDDRPEHTTACACVVTISSFCTCGALDREPWVSVKIQQDEEEA